VAKAALGIVLKNNSPIQLHTDRIRRRSGKQGSALAHAFIFSAVIEGSVAQDGGESPPKTDSDLSRRHFFDNFDWAQVRFRDQELPRCAMMLCKRLQHLAQRKGL
jgi:hypothetical protein